MKKKSSGLSICERSAERIHYWFGRDKETIFHHLIGSHELLQGHKCNLVKIPRVPSQVGHLPLYGYEFAREKKQSKLETIKKREINLAFLKKDITCRFKRATLEIHCCVNQKNPYLLEEMHTLAGFAAERVIKNWQLKEHFFAFRKLKSLGKTRIEDPNPKLHKIIPLGTIKKSSLASEDQEYWESLIRSKENRLFNIDRVPK